LARGFGKSSLNKLSYTIFSEDDSSSKVTISNYVLGVSYSNRMVLRAVPPQTLRYSNASAMQGILAP
jgi:hypothetical protein